MLIKKKLLSKVLSKNIKKTLYAEGIQLKDYFY